MDSHVLKSHKGHIKSITEEQIKLADKKYISSVYFHTLFLFAIAKSRNYSVKQGDSERDITEFLKDVFYDEQGTRKPEGITLANYLLALADFQERNGQSPTKDERGREYAR